MTSFLRKFCAVLIVVFALALSAQAGTILTGWIYSSGQYGYSSSESAWLYFHHTQPIWHYNFNSGLWAQEINGWSWVDLPYIYSTQYASWLYVVIPAGSYFVYNFSTGTWTEQPAT